ncbi:class I SAM-dependent methyltransferase [Patescibacteria group bacterium]
MRSRKENEMKTVKDYYKTRFNPVERKRKDKIWHSLCRYAFQKYISYGDVVLDIGAGYCEFINHIKCRRKIAIDINPETKKYANKNVEVFNLNIDSLKKTFREKIDVVFVSNFLEHLNCKEEIINIIDASYYVLKPGGKIIVIQPNIKLVGERYWDFIDHKQPLTVSSIVEALMICNFRIVKTIEKFLPFTTKNSYPIFSWMIYMYLKVPFFLRIGTGQSLVVAKK